MEKIIIRNYTANDRKSMIQLHEAVNKQWPDSVYWWPGEKETWGYVICAFNGEQMIAKGQVQPINVLSESSPSGAVHQIYLNIKVHPDWDHVNDLKERIYAELHRLALELKKDFPAKFATMLCVGNKATEVTNNQYFAGKGFEYFKSIYGMRVELERVLQAKISPDTSLEMKYWTMETEQEQKNYLQMESQIWPDFPLGANRLQEYRNKPKWTAIKALYKGEWAGNVMAWQDSEDTGTIEDLFVMPEWRNKGIARELLREACRYLKERGMSYAELSVLVDNETALNLYQSVGFETVEEEQRFWVLL